MPRVQRQVPDARLLLVGRDPTPELVEVGHRRGVEVTGFVDDVRPYLEAATVFAAPLRFGVGIQNKVLEAMAMELPVVASPLAADGLRTVEGQRPPIRIARDPGQFAEMLVRHLGERADHLKPYAEARRFVERHFVWQRSGERLESVIRSLAESSRG